MERIKAYQEGTLKATTVDNGAGIWQKWANANGDTDWFEEFMIIGHHLRSIILVLMVVRIRLNT